MNKQLPPTEYAQLGVGLRDTPYGMSFYELCCFSSILSKYSS